MRLPRFFVTGLLIFSACGGALAAPPSMVYHNEGNVDENEQAAMAADPGRAQRQGPVLTLMANGRRVATFTDINFSWTYGGHAELIDRDGAKRTAYIVWLRDMEWWEDLLLTPDGTILEVGGGITVATGGRFIAGGVIADEMERAQFQIFDWHKQQVYAFAPPQIDATHLSDQISMCEPEKAEPGDRFTVTCSTEDMSRGFFGEASQLPDGRWQIVPAEGWEGERFADYLDLDALKHVPLAPAFAQPIVLEAAPVEDRTKRHAEDGFKWLGEKAPGQ